MFNWFKIKEKTIPLRKYESPVIPEYLKVVDYWNMETGSFYPKIKKIVDERNEIQSKDQFNEIVNVIKKDGYYASEGINKIVTERLIKEGFVIKEGTKEFQDKYGLHKNIIYIVTVG